MRSSFKDCPFGRVVLAAVSVLATTSSSARADMTATDAAVMTASFVRTRPLALEVGARFLCPDAATWGYCVGGLQLGFAFRYGDVHLGLLGTAGQNSDQTQEGLSVRPYVAPFGGFELGTRYYYFVFKNGNTPVALGLALRADADFIGLLPAVDHADLYDHFFAFTNTLGPNAQLLIGSRWALTARLGAGWGARIRTNSGVGTFNPVYAAAVDAIVALQARF